MKILLIRFSSFGDVLQTLSVAGRLGVDFPDAEIHWVTRHEFAPLLETHPRVHKVWSLSQGASLNEVLKLGAALRREGFTHIYDAHNNLRSHILSLLLNGVFAWRLWTGRQKFLRRSIYRWRRFMLFRFHRNLFPQPFSGQFALLEPLKKWGLRVEAPPIPQLFLDARQVAETLSRVKLAPTMTPFVTLAPSASYPLKRWPIEYWKELISNNRELNFVLLGGPLDTFMQELEAVDPRRVVNLAGRLTLQESAHMVAASQALVSNDTGLMHVAEQIGKPCLALMGPAPFGFPSRSLTQILEVKLSCRPCSKHGQGPCVNPEFQKCLRDIRPQTVSEYLRRSLHAKMDAPLSPR